VTIEPAPLPSPDDSHDDAHTAPRHPVRISEILTRLASTPGRDRITLGDLIDALEARAFGVLMLVLSLPNVVGVGTVPGVSTLFGAPQLLFAIQMMAGAKSPWLPQRFMRASIATVEMARIVEKVRPRLEKVERRLRPRLLALTTPFAERMTGFMYLLLATAVALPIPLANNLPSVAMTVMSLGFIAFDGAFVLAGILIGLVSLVVAVLVVLGGIAAFWKLLSFF
jgi:hypothetical protein